MHCSVTIQVHDHVDPLKKLVHLILGDELGKGNYNPFQAMIFAFAKANDCTIEKITKAAPKRYILHALVKSRLGQVQDKNPLKSSDKSRNNQET